MRQVARATMATLPSQDKAVDQQVGFYEAKLQFETDSWDLFDALQGAENVVVIDARGVEAYERERIPNALNLPHRNMSGETTAHFDKSATYVIYCDGIGCNASTKGALKMAKLGFSVRELIGGLDWWKRDGYATGGAEGQAGRAVVCGC